MKREKLLQKVWKEQDIAYSLMYEYDSTPRYYGESMLYQMEAYMVYEIGNAPDITISELAERMNKTKSACSQMVKKLLKKGFVIQIRDDNNRRRYHLRLTSTGRKVYEAHKLLNHTCQQETFSMLDTFTDEELMQHLQVQKILNACYRKDIERSKEIDY